MYKMLINKPLDHAIVYHDLHFQNLIEQQHDFHVTKQLYLDEDFDELDSFELYLFFVDVIMNHVIIDIIMDNIQRNIDLLNLSQLLQWLLVLSSVMMILQVNTEVLHPNSLQNGKR